MAALGYRNRTGPVGRSYNEGVNSNKEAPSNNEFFFFFETNKAALGVTGFTIRKRLDDYLPDCPALSRWYLRPHILWPQN